MKGRIGCELPADEVLPFPEISQRGNGSISSRGSHSDIMILY